MNKFFIVVLAVCLVSVHAFVKREAEVPKEKNYFDDAIKSIQQSAQTVGSKMSELFNPENVQKQFSELLDGANKAIKEFSSGAGSHNKDEKQ